MKREKKIHYYSKSMKVVVCDNSWTVPHYPSTADVTKVTCGSCKNTKVYKEALEKHNKANKVEKKSYIKRQNEWIKENNIQVGDKVRITRQAERGEDGWGWKEEWPERKIAQVGTVQTIRAVQGKYGVEIDYNYFPYFVLEKVEVIEEPVIEKPKRSFTYKVINKYIDRTIDHLPYMLIKQYLEEGKAIFMEENNPERMFQIEIKPVDFLIGEHNG